jgi:hypothetical protein
VKAWKDGVLDGRRHGASNMGKHNSLTDEGPHALRPSTPSGHSGTQLLDARLFVDPDAS